MCVRAGSDHDFGNRISRLCRRPHLHRAAGMALSIDLLPKTKNYVKLIKNRKRG
jgi:hypothetical protein